MAKIPWSRPDRPPRIKVTEPIAGFAPVGPDRCETCVGMGALYRVEGDGTKTPIECWTCKGSGKAEIVADGSSVTTAAGWCAPSSVIYDIPFPETDDGSISGNNP